MIPSPQQILQSQVGITAVAIAPSDPDVIYLAAYDLGGLYRSTDGGATWRAASAGLESLAPLTIAVHPANPDVAWAGSMVRVR